MILKTMVIAVALFFNFNAIAMAADQCEFIRSAVADLPETGGVVNIPEGVYDCTNMIVLKKSNVVVRGAGRDQTILRLANQSHSPVLVIGDDNIIKNSTGDYVTATRVTNVEVSDLTVDGNVENQDVNRECGYGPCDGDVTNIRNNAITIRGASYVTLARITAHDSISGGLVSEKYCDHLHVTDFSSYGNHFDGFAGYQTSDSLFENVNLSRNRGAGISIDIDFNNNHFLNGVLESNGDVGIFARDTNDVVFEKLLITKSGNHGAFLAASEHENTCANRNEFRSVIIEGSRGNGIHISSPCAGNKVTGNSIFRNNSNGCYFVNYQTKMSVESSVVCEN
ncbi:MAG: right-handed parallel beta-helix repeat-containing protein [Bacteriovorax sp.]|nr:right-handed parallel beta-helix repeat-containing protein [Bacteriovorax sp.]